MILETSEILRFMAEMYSVPELAYFSSENYFSQIGTSHGVKRHFSYLHHEENQQQNPAHLLQAIIPKQPGDDDYVTEIQFPVRKREVELNLLTA